MKRRDFVAGLGGTAAWPLLARAQQAERVRRIAVLTSSGPSDQEGQSSVAAFQEELRKFGWIERNSKIDIRWTAADVGSMERFAKELVALRPDLILTSSTAATAAMLQQTRTIPIVFVLVADPVGNGFVASLARPGGNTTGFTPIIGSLGGKWVELLKEIAPASRTDHVAVQPANGAASSEPFWTHSKPPPCPSVRRRLSHPLMTSRASQSLVITEAREPRVVVGSS